MGSKSASMKAFNAGPEVTHVDLTCDVRYIELHLGVGEG
jgi:hypothetical protein